MRWYKIQAAGLTFDATGDPNALNVEFDIPVTSLHVPSGKAFARVWGIDLKTLLNANSYNNQPITVYGGMQAGLPLANPGEAGLLVQGNIFPALGNWVGTDMTLDFYIGPPLGGNNPGRDANIVHNWPANTPLSGPLKQTLQTAFPKLQVLMNISPNLKLPHDDRGMYQTLGQYANYIQKISWSILGSQKNYRGVNIVMNRGNLVVTDGTQTAGGPQIAFQDLIGQPIWTGPQSIQFKTVMRGDIQINDKVKLPQTLATLTPAAGTAVGSSASNLLSGQFRITGIRHTGNFRQPDWPSWATTFDALKATS
jgi:hypothetical protein